MEEQGEEVGGTLAGKGSRDRCRREAALKRGAME